LDYREQVLSVVLGIIALRDVYIRARGIYDL
jgi:hypothetical protein